MGEGAPLRAERRSITVMAGSVQILLVGLFSTFFSFMGSLLFSVYGESAVFAAD
jgi:hypothetical protein